MRQSLALFVLGGLAAVPALAGIRAREAWSGSWAASPAPPLAAAPGLPAAALARAFRNQTVEQVVRLSIGGSGLRLRLTNEYGSKPLRVGAASVTLIDAAGAMLPGTRRVVSFGTRPGIVIPSGAPAVSDTVTLTIPARARVKVSLYFPEDTGLCTCHGAGGQTARVSRSGDYTGTPFTPVDTFTARAFLSEVDVVSATPRPVIVAFGDSITDGYSSTVDTDRRWPDRLAERLLADRRFARYGVVNAALSGNRILADGQIALFGQNALSRFDRDALSVPGVRTIVLLEGVNDIGQAKDDPPDAETLIAGYRQLIARAHAKGIRMVGATLLPYAGAAYYLPKGDAIRRTVNQWIKTSGAFDAVIDFDKAMRDPAHPERLRSNLQSGDWLHPNDAGYRVMGDMVPLGLLR